MFTLYLLYFCVLKLLRRYVKQRTQYNDVSRNKSSRIVVLIDVRRFGLVSRPAAQVELLTDVLIPGEGRGRRVGEESVSRGRLISTALFLIFITLLCQ